MPFDRLLLCLEGLSVGNAFGTSFYYPEAGVMIARRELSPAPWPWTADTRMALAVVAELQAHGSIDQDSLAHRLGLSYREDPARGYGSQTRQLLERIATGENWHAAANGQPDSLSSRIGAVVRAVPIGACFAGDPQRAAVEARKAAEVTHPNGEGTAGAVAVAVITALVAQPGHFHGSELLFQVSQYIPDGPVRQKVLFAAGIPENDLAEAARVLGSGAEYTAPDTVPFSLWCAAHTLYSYEEALWRAVSTSGNRSTICAIVGGILALAVQKIPADWVRMREPLPNEFEFIQGNELLYAGKRNQPAAVHDRPDPNVSSYKEDGLPTIHKDILTGLPNLLGLFDCLGAKVENNPAVDFHIVVLQIFSLYQVNRNQGRSAGDALLKNGAIALRNQYGRLAFRIGGDRFAVLFEGQAPAEIIRQAQWLQTTINVEKESPDYSPNRAAVIHFSAGETVPGNVLSCLYEALSNRHFEDKLDDIREFEAANIHAVTDFPWMMVDLTRQMMSLGTTADELLRLAQTDDISQLPNMRAALSQWDTLLRAARLDHKPMAALLADGDNLRQYNKISYDAGDEAIRLIGKTLRQQLREADFLARWRTGDEFLILLYDTSPADALEVSQRLCRSVEQASQDWPFPTTISIGLALFPKHGETIDELLHAAELGLSTSKRNGKNQVNVVENPAEAETRPLES